MLLLIALVLLIYLCRLGTLSVRGEESRRAGIAFEMLETGDWITTTIQRDAVFYRPPLQNWAIALSCMLHDSRGAWAVRLPSVLAILGTCLLVYGYSRNFLSPLGAFGAAAAYATMVQVLELGRTAETEAIFTVFTSGSLLVWHWGYVRQWAACRGPSWRTWSAAYGLAALGTLAKGLQPPVYLFASTAIFLLWRRQLRAFFSLAHLAGLLAFTLVLGAWLVPYLSLMGGKAGIEILAGEAGMKLMDNIQRAFGHMLQFPAETLVCTLPWSALLLAFGSRAFRQSIGEAKPMVTFCAISLLVTFPSCWLPAGARCRYWMPMYPVLAPLLGLVVQRFMEAPAEWMTRRRRLWLSVAGTSMVGAAVLAVASSWWPWSWPDLRLPELRLPHSQALLFALAACILACLVLAGRNSPSILAVAGCGLFLGLTYDVWYTNFRQAQSADLEAAIIPVKRVLPPQTELVSFGQVHHRFFYYYGKPIRVVPWPKSRAELPANTYFCFDRIYQIYQPRQIPMDWEKLAEFPCDRYVPCQEDMKVIVGRTR